MSRAYTINFNSFTKTLSQSSVLESLSDIQVLVTEFELFCHPDNVGTINIGYSDDQTWIPRTPGSKHNFGSEELPAEGGHFDLEQIKISGTAGDKVIIQYRVKI